MGPTTEEVNPLEKLGDRLHDGSQSTENLLLNILMSQIYIFLACFFIVVTHHGNFTVGQRFATFTFYAMEEQETLLSALLANGAFYNVVSIGVR